MRTKGRGLVAAVVAITAGTAALCATRNFIHAKARKGQDNPNLGFGWDFINHSADIVDCTKQLGNELKWGLQRFVRGYDDTVFWNFDSYMDMLIIQDLRWMIKHRHGSPVLDDWTEEDCHEKFTELLKEMLYHFEQSQDEFCQEKNEYEDEVDFEHVFESLEDGSRAVMEHKNKSAEAEALREKYVARSREIEDYKTEHHNKALDMLKKYYRYLWD